MTKDEALKIIKLLSALESWAFSTKAMLPEYLHEDLCEAVKTLDAIVLEEKNTIIQVAADPLAFYGFPNGSVSSSKVGGNDLTAGETAP